MADALTIDKSTTALLSMDFQNGILAAIPEPLRAPVVEKATATLAAARKAQLLVAHIVVRFRAGHPEVSPRNMRFADAKKSNRLADGSPAAENVPALAPQGNEPVFHKVRVGAFSTTNLETVTRSNDITTLVMQGIFTSGVVLSTVRWAADMDYRMIVIADACADPDAEVHRVLLEKVLNKQATVITAAEFAKALG